MPHSTNRFNYFLFVACLLIVSSAFCEILSKSGLIAPYYAPTLSSTLEYSNSKIQVLERNSSDASGPPYQTGATGRIFNYDYIADSRQMIELSPVLHNGKSKVFSLEQNEVYEEYPSGKLLLNVDTENIMICSPQLPSETPATTEYRRDTDLTQHIDIRCTQQEELHSQRFPDNDHSANARHSNCR